MPNFRDQIWGYWKFTEDAEGVFRADATGQNHHFVESAGDTFPDRASALFTPFCNVFTSNTDYLKTAQFTFDPVLTPWTWWGMVYIGTPASTANIISGSIDNPNQFVLSYTWSGSVLKFVWQQGFFSDLTTEFKNEISITGLSSPINGWFFVGLSFPGPTVGSTFPPDEKYCLLRVNNLSNKVPALALDAIVPPTHEAVSDSFYVAGPFNPFVGKLGPAALYINRAFSSADFDALYNNGNGLALPY